MSILFKFKGKAFRINNSIKTVKMEEIEENIFFKLNVTSLFKCQSNHFELNKVIKNENKNFNFFKFSTINFYFLTNLSTDNDSLITTIS